MGPFAGNLLIVEETWSCGLAQCSDVNLLPQLVEVPRGHQVLEEAERPMLCALAV